MIEEHAARICQEDVVRRSIEQRQFQGIFELRDVLAHIGRRLAKQLGRRGETAMLHHARENDDIVQIKSVEARSGCIGRTGHRQAIGTCRPFRQLRRKGVI
nr:hypothetical protein [Ensifer sp. SSB1]